MDVPKTAINWRVLCAALGLSFAFGSIHAFAVLLPEIEIVFQSGRGSTSLAYSVTIVSLTGGVYLYPSIRAFWSARQIALVAGFAGAFGMLLPIFVPSLVGLYLGYGVLFGFSNGVAYMLFLDQARFALRPKEGFAVGLATAFYGLGSAGFALILALTLKSASLQHAWVILALSVLLAGITSYFALGREPQKIAIHENGIRITRSYSSGLTLKLWMIYFLAACGGLIVIVHSAEIVLWHSQTSAAHVYAPSVNALGNIAGCIIGGWLADRFPVRTTLAGSQILVLISGIVLFSDLSVGIDLTAVAIIGLCYGALISIIPTAVRRLVGEAASADVFKRVFTAWGAAGLVGPSFAGLMFDMTGGYAVAITLSCSLAAVSFGIILLLDQVSD